MGPSTVEWRFLSKAGALRLNSTGVGVLRPIPVFGFYGVPDRASEVVFTDVRVPVGNILLGEGRGFEVAQGALDPAVSTIVCG
jgi:hypothetical protein